jgi:hypothetical protein
MFDMMMSATLFEPAVRVNGEWLDAPEVR